MIVCIVLFVKLILIFTISAIRRSSQNPESTKENTQHMINKLFIDFNSNEIYDFMQKQPKPSEQEVKQTMEKYSKILKRDK